MMRESCRRDIWLNHHHSFVIWPWADSDRAENGARRSLSRFHNLNQFTNWLHWTKKLTFWSSTPWPRSQHRDTHGRDESCPVGRTAPRLASIRVSPRKCACHARFCLQLGSYAFVLNRNVYTRRSMKSVLTYVVRFIEASITAACDGSDWILINVALLAPFQMTVIVTDHDLELV